ncbi:MAG: tRNA (adenosine(37)-N6)-threonylcarbamoyltransferase complex dimerization subunit type 1 TsaB [Tannerella sp.]|jgi:tRNA threonylcarbamoyladenosine biosynthesis protein TsaB|nr:tRNA (adenosine(37)-N6)-threonylcarbamoyltransferase complex dimerization subunit type 1 TsaB [Tannerella sp.]
MASVLCLETSTAVCSVAVSVNGVVVFEKTVMEGPSHAALLGVFVEEAQAACGGANWRPDAVAVGGGPGSYTGLRISTAMAKGLCMGWDIPLIAVPTLEIMASEAIRRHPADDCLYCAMLDARRMEVYAAVYDRTLASVRATQAEIVTPETYRSLLRNRTVCFFGNGAAKCRTVIPPENALFIDDIHPLAAEMAPLVEKAFAAGRFENVAYFEPFYLKEFIATVPKNKVLTRS